MRTTLDIPDDLYCKLKVKAAGQKTTVKALVLRGVESVLSGDGPVSLPRLQLPLIAGGVPGSLNLDNDRIYDLIDFP